MQAMCFNFPSSGFRRPSLQSQRLFEGKPAANVIWPLTGYQRGWKAVSVALPAFTHINARSRSRTSLMVNQGAATPSPI